MSKAVEHAHFTIDRQFDFAPAKVWHAWTDPTAKTASGTGSRP